MKYIIRDNKMYPVENEFELLDYDRPLDFLDTPKKYFYFRNEGFKLVDGKTRKRIFGKFVDIELDGIYSPIPEKYNVGKYFTRMTMTLRKEDVEILETNKIKVT